MKECTLCKKEKELIFFTTKTGNIRSRCKECLSRLQREWNAKNPEKVKEIKRKKYKKHKTKIDAKNKEWAGKNREASRKIKAKYREKNRDTLREKGREYFHQNKDIFDEWKRQNKEKRKETLQKYSDNHPEKRDVRQKLYRALKAGKLTKPEECSECGSRENIQGHHEDYSKPFEVIWLCAKCHMKRHRK